MSQIESKNDLLKEISATKSLSEGSILNSITKMNKTLRSLTNRNNMKLQFVEDILTTLTGVQAIRKAVINVFAKDLPIIEYYLKTALKIQLKETINCASNPSIPSFLQYSGTGVQMSVRNIDFMGLFFIPPTSKTGQLVYEDPNSGLNSKDFDVFLYSTIQSLTEQQWMYKGNSVLAVNYALNGAPVGGVPTTDVFIVKASNYYSNNMKLTDLNNDFIDSLSLLPPAQKINEIFDNLFGTIASAISLPMGWLKKQAEVHTVLQHLDNVADNTIIDDSYFSFTNEEVTNIQNTASNRSNGIRKYISCNEIQSSLDINSLTAMTASILTANTSTFNLIQTVSTSLDNISSYASSNASNEDTNSFKLAFFQDIFDSILYTITNTLLSPKLALLLQLNHKIVYGQNSNVTDPISYIMDNRTMFYTVMKAIRAILLNIIMQLVIVELTKLMQENNIKNQAEQTRAYTAILESLIGINPEIERIMSLIRSIPNTV